MSTKFGNDSRLRFFIGDIRDKDRLKRALEGVDIVVHAAALKIVPFAEYNPIEYIKTNINGAINLVEASLDVGVKKIVALSTDKASSPINLYGATKLASDKIFIASNSYSGYKKTCFSVVRYGNVMGSRGSIIPFLLSFDKSKKIPLTNEKMTRFMISLDQAIELVWTALDDMLGGEIYVKKIPSMKVVDIIKAILPYNEKKVIGVRPGEKIHEQMISSDDAPYTYEYENFYKILPAINFWNLDKARIKNGIKVSEDFKYSSDINSEWMNVEFLRNWIEENKSFFGEF